MKLVKGQNQENTGHGGPSPALIEECFHQLTEKKSQLLNQLSSLHKEHRQRDFSGDEVDQSLNVLAENEFLAQQERARLQLLEIEMALGRIENGTYGVCEETEEFIEIERLRAIPWTRLSIEGAEIREALIKRFAR